MPSRHLFRLDEKTKICRCGTTLAECCVYAYRNISGISVNAVLACDFVLEEQ